jgi:hypothetical protein
MVKILTICAMLVPVAAYADGLERGPIGGWGVPPSLSDRIEAEHDGRQAEIEATDKADALQRQLDDERSRRDFWEMTDPSDR